MFTPETVNLAVRFSNKVAAAMENAKLHGSEQQKLKEMMALLEVARLVTSTLDIDVLLTRLVQITADVCEVGKCSAYIYCLLYTSDAADEEDSVDLGGRRIIK